jgi:glycopeptide antibiotics resistance protein
MVYNFLIFIPFGLLLDVNLKKVRFLTKFILILIYSITAELIQYIFAIGATDITDVITNTLGGLLGLILYDFISRFITKDKLDKLILYLGIVLFILFISMHLSHFAFRLRK